MIVKLKGQRKHQEVREARTMECMLRKATSSEQSYPQREAMRAETDSATGVMLPTPFGIYIFSLGAEH